MPSEEQLIDRRGAMWGGIRLGAYAAYALLLGAALGYQAWLATLVLKRLAEHADGVAASAATEVQTAVSHLASFAFLSPILIVWAFVDYARIKARAHFPLPILALTVLTLIGALGSFVLLAAAGNAHGDASTRLTGVVIGGVAVIVSLMVSLVWMLVISRRAMQMLKRND